jgi:hypothetical protein
LRGRDDNTASENIAVYITSIPQRGVLRDGTNDEAMAITSASSANPHRVTNEARQISFTPGLHENGDDYASFTFKLVDSLGLESTFTITYDVTPVNSAPEIIPVNFNHDFVIVEGEATSLLFNAEGSNKPYLALIVTFY